jgi:hypothetical protein
MAVHAMPQTAVVATETISNARDLLSSRVAVCSSPDADAARARPDIPNPAMPQKMPIGNQSRVATTSAATRMLFARATPEGVAARCVFDAHCVPFT